MAFIEKAPRTTLHYGKVVGKMQFEELPPAIRERISDLLHLRTARNVLVPIAAMLGACWAITPNDQQKYIGAPIVAASTVGATYANREVRRETLRLGNELRRFSNNPWLKELKEKGATHVLMQGRTRGRGTLVFVKAPKHEGKAFRPVIGRMRAPLDEKPKG
ncbi:MAG: hypothetical protein V1722_02080 [Candidatus Micrarchaeota archaeon]